MKIAILSGKGGTGKTTVCAGLALELAAQGCRVLCIDLDRHPGYKGKGEIPWAASRAG